MAGKSAQCNCGAVLNIPAAGMASPAPPVSQNAADPFGMQPADPLGFSAADPLGVADAQPAYGQPAPPPANPYWAQGGSQSGKPKKRKVKKKRHVPEDEGMDGGDMGAIGGIVGGILLGGLGVVLTFASMSDEGYTVYYGLMIFGAITAFGGIARLVTGD